MVSDWVIELMTTGSVAIDPAAAAVTRCEFDAYLAVASSAMGIPIADLVQSREGNAKVGAGTCPAHVPRRSPDTFRASFR